MKITRTGGIAALALTGALALSSCAANETQTTDDSSTASTLTGTIDAGGAGSQASAEEAWVAAFQEANPDVTINYTDTGSGTGRSNFIDGSFDFAGTDSALSDDEIAGGFALCVDDSFIQVPAFIDPIAVIYNVDGVDELNLDSTTIAKIFKGEITNWNDPAIAALNEGTTFPDLAITAVHRSDDSGTTKNFTDYLFQTAPDVWTEAAADKFPYSTGEAAQGTSGVVDAVTNGTGTIGYASASRAGEIGVAKIKVGDEFVEYSAEAAAAVVDGSPAADNASDTNLAIKINRVTDNPDEYPLVLVSYLIACGEYQDATLAPVVKAYLAFVTSEEGQEIAAGTGSAPLSSSQISAVQSVIDTIVVTE
ncbi:MAG: phosphate ABC transporter substrate-binding protein PstS [Protaetiibacter sp.]